MQRKRHINFKDFLIRISDARISTLHSIPIYKMKNKTKSNMLYSIPCVKSRAHFYGTWIGTFTILSLMIIMGMAITNGKCYAVYEGTATDAGTITPVSGGGSTAATSLSISNNNMVSDITTPGSTAVVSTDVTVDVHNAENYSLILSVDNANLINGSTTIQPGNAVDDNTWGYKWDNASTYTTPSTTGTTLTSSILDPLDSNGSTSFTKNLTFGAKFASNAENGHYRGGGILSLVATPKETSTISLANLTQMQQLTLAPEACANTPYLDGAKYSAEYRLTDVRDNNTYTVRKFNDGKCWMTSNLRLSNDSHTGGRSLIPTTSDISSNWTLPPSSTSGFATSADIDAYISGNIGYYTWCAATATTCNSVTTSGVNAASSICPKGWKLPTGGTGGDFAALVAAQGIADSEVGSAEIRNVPYNFAYTGRMSSSNLEMTDSIGFWWSRTAGSSTGAYRFIIRSSSVGRDDRIPSRSDGYAVRCVAAEPKTFTLTYDVDPENHQPLAQDDMKLPQPQTCETTDSSCTITTRTSGDVGPTYCYSLKGWTLTNGSSTVDYALGADIILSKDTTLYAVWEKGTCSYW